MSIMTVTMSTIRVELPDELPLCTCGGKLTAVNHFRKRRPKELVATVALCDNKKCRNHMEGYIGYDIEDLKKRIVKFQKGENTF